VTDGPVRSADELVPDLSGDLTRLASQIGEPYDYLRTLLATLPSPFLPTLREARSSPANPVADASQFGTGLGLAGGPIGQSSGTEIGSGIANLDIYNVPALAGGGFPVAWRRFLTGGVYNGDFGTPTLVSANNVENITNPMPYWAFVQSVQTTVTCKWASLAGSASGGSASFSMAASVGGDEGYLEQVIPVNGTVAQSFSYDAVAAVLRKNAGSLSSIHFFIEAQFLKNDKVTTTGTSDRVTASTTNIGVDAWADLRVLPNGGILPADAYYFRIRIGLVETSGTGHTRSGAQIGEVRLGIGQQRVYIAATPTTLGPAWFDLVAWPVIAGSGTTARSLVAHAIAGDRFTSDIPYSWPVGANDYVATASLVATTTPTDITGCTVTFTPDVQERVIVTGVFDVDISVASTAAAVGNLVVDGVTQTESAIFRQNTAAGRATVTQKWIVALTAASHTLKLQGSKSAALGTIQFNLDHTKMVVERQGGYGI
jgi:hypothetical protein